jgi:hypothetical protein
MIVPAATLIKLWNLLTYYGFKIYEITKTGAKEITFQKAWGICMKKKNHINLLAQR